MINLGIWLVCITSLSVSPNLQLGQQQVTLHGQIYDSLFGLPISGANVQVFEGHRLRGDSTSDQSGNYEIKGLAAGRHIVKVTLSGFVTAEQSVDLDSGKRRFDVGLKAGYVHPPLPIAISGVVIGTDGVPIANATIVLVRPFDREMLSKASSTETGRYDLRVDEPGQYVLYAYKPGFNVRTAEIVVWPKVPREPQEINFVLTAFKIR